MLRTAPLLLLATVLAFTATPAHARTVYRCVQGGTVSLATAPEPGSRCVAKTIADDAAKLPN
ncbi:MAG: lytic transglycosylase domain-containing protein, partial [Arenimonas sp.]